ncbi:periplasmic binding protein-like II [Coniochaeta sp. PMI_546]|nr:periplasmic binding protein-like II [Coniochaeta sp. PMI_546]
MSSSFQEARLGFKAGPYAIKNFYKGDTAQLVSGGVANIATDRTIDLAANAETQGLIQYGSHQNIRIIYTIVDVGYRLIANKASGIRTLADLKGKKIGTMQSSSAAYFVSKMLSSAGLKDTDYTVVSGQICMKAPCGQGTFPQMLASRQIDAFGIWEPAVELAAKALGDNAVIFQNTSIYREVYSLYSTKEKLGDPTIRKNIVAFVKALNQTLDVFTNNPKSVYATVAAAVGMDVSIVEAVWPVHKWSGTLAPDLLPFMVEEDRWVAKQNRRQAMSNTSLATFIDSSVLDDARKG